MSNLPDSQKFRDPMVTAKGEQRAVVALGKLRTLWFNTGSLCNIACEGCYVLSGPRNDALVYPGPDDTRPFLDELAAQGGGTAEIGFTGGEPFMNPHIVALLDQCLARGHRAVVLTNAMTPMNRHRQALRDLGRRFGDRLSLRVSIDHHTAERHELLRGPGTWARAWEGLTWLVEQGLAVAVAGRTRWGEPEPAARAAYAVLFRQRGVPVDAADPAGLVLFPEMTPTRDVPEITTACWSLLRRAPDSVMCASSRMVVKRKGAAAPVVVACTLLPYDSRFELGATLAEAARSVPLNHPYCAQFCVLGGGACSLG